MYHVFNMGIGMVIMASADNAAEITRQVPEARQIGEITRLTGNSRVVLD
jgi:phosphoribosylformylglycinamidine cyclo-ligase